MATTTSSNSTATSSIAPAAPPAPAPPIVPRPLRREGAMYILTPEEEALQDAMLRSSSPAPEPETSALGRTRDNDDEGDGAETEPETEPPTTSQALVPNASNVTAAALRYATQKRIRSEQRGELDTFLSASPFLKLHFLLHLIDIVQDSAVGRQARIFVCLLSIENKIEAFQSASPPYQVSEELKVSN